MKTFFLKLFKNSEVNLARQANNIDFIRLIAASLVIIAHAPYILNLDALSWDPMSKIYGINMGRLGVFIFFIISGYLITMSWQKKKDIVDFTLARILRIYPAVIIVVILSVFILGPLLTTISIGDYFNSSITKQYIQDATLFRMYYYLPGVFESNPTHSINGSLWTLPYEFTCYIFIGILGLMKIISNKKSAIIFYILLIFVDFFFDKQVHGIVIPIIGIDFKTFFPLFLYFISGSLFYILRDNIKLNILGAIVSTIILYCSKGTTISAYLSPILLTYIIITLAFYEPLPFKRIGKYGDLSYGLYLYAFPVQQLIVYVLGNEISLFTMIILSFLLTLPFAYFSWHFIEKPSIQMRKRYYNPTYLQQKLNAIKTGIFPNR